MSPEGWTGSGSPVLAVLPVWACPGLGGLVAGGALSARVACTWASARIRLRLLWPRVVRACSSSCSAFGVVLAGAAHHGLRLPGCPLLME